MDEETYEIEVFKSMLNEGVQRLSLSKEEVIEILDKIYK